MPCCWQSSAALVDSLWFLRRAGCHSRDALFACLILITAEQLPVSRIIATTNDGFRFHTIALFAKRVRTVMTGSIITH